LSGLTSFFGKIRSWNPDVVLKVPAMRRRKQQPVQKALRKSWGRWVQIVELFALRRAARKKVDPHTYATVHRELIAKCRSLATSANDVEAAFYRYLEDLALPWLDPTILARADREILYDLLLRCHRVEQELGGRSFWRMVPSGPLPVVAAVLIFASTLLWVGKFSILLTTSMEYARSWGDDAVFRVLHSSTEERLCAVACILVAVSIYAVSRTARS
jgi:hypothetical protein